MSSGNDTGLVVGIDLGTTNSEIAGFLDDQVRVFANGQQYMLPSCVGLSPGGELLIGQAARNQQLLYPQRTIRSVKRKMGTHEPIRLGDKSFSPPDISALILRELAQWAQRSLGEPVKRAVITVPAYFSDAQRQATREAGALAGLEVVRLVNEPTAASLAYGYGEHEDQTLMVYDLGGGTFDVSIVRIENQVTEVLASHGNNQLGGDDFDQLLLDHLLGVFKEQHGVDLRQEEYRGAWVRLAGAAEEAKKRLSFEPFTTVREEALVHVDGRPLHLELEVARSDYERMIRPLIDSTLDSVSQALSDAGKSPGQIDVVLLVGGSTRTPLVSEILERHMGKAPRQDVHPELCVALGAGVLAARLSGRDVPKVLIDVCPYSFGVSYLGARDGESYPYCYKPIIRRNTPLPVTRAELFYTAYPFQEAVEVEIFQGEHEDALHNTRVGNFQIEGLTPTEKPNDVLCRMKLDLDGVLEVTAIEKRSGLSRQVSITDSLRPRHDGETDSARQELDALFASRLSDDESEMELEDEEAPEGAALKLVGREDEDDREPVEASGDADQTQDGDPQLRQTVNEARQLLARSRKLINDLHEDDRVEAVDLNEQIEMAIGTSRVDAVSQATEQLREFLFFVEGR